MNPDIAAIEAALATRDEAVRAEYVAPMAACEAINAAHQCVAGAANPARLRRILDTMGQMGKALSKTSAVCAGQTTDKRGLIGALEAARAALAAYRGEQQ